MSRQNIVNSLCKYNNELSPEEFIARIFELSSKFANSFKTENKVNFSYMQVRKVLCNTVACHGGWGAVIFSVGLEYDDGATAIANHLGFKYSGKLIGWASNNPKYWGNDYGSTMFMFNGYFAFGTFKPGIIDLLSIAQWYANVGERLLIECKDSN